MCCSFLCVCMQMHCANVVKIAELTKSFLKYLSKTTSISAVSLLSVSYLLQIERKSVVLGG